MAETPLKTLSAQSVKTYEGCLERLRHSLEEAELVDEPKTVIEEIQRLFANLSTQKVYLSAVMWYIKEQNKEAWDVLKAYFDKIRPGIDKRATAQTLTVSASALYVPWDTLKTAGKKAIKMYKEGTLPLADALIAVLYTEQAPVRADYGGMEFITDIRKASNPEINYCLIRGTKPIFIFNHYKTQKSYGKIVVPIKRSVYHLLLSRYSEMAQKGSNLVFTENQPNFSAKVKRVFGALTGKEVGISLLRHSYITDFLKTNPSIHDKQEVAYKMMNSVAIQDAYRVLDDKTIKEDGE